MRIPLLAAAVCMVCVAPDIAQAAPLSVTLLDPGKAPRTELRFHPKVGASRQVKLTMDSAIEMSIGGNSLPAGRTPPMIMMMRVDVTKVGDDGNIRYEFELSGVEVGAADGVPPGMVDMLKKSLDQLKGTTGYGVVSSTGRTLDGGVKMAKGAGPEMQQLVASLEDNMSQLSAPVPVEAVGVGARWRVDQTLEMQGVEVSQSAVYTLESVGKTFGKMGVTVTQSAKPQRVSPPGLPPSVQAELVSLSGDGTGAISFALDEIVPPASSINASTKMVMAMSVQGTKQEMVMNAKIGMSVKSAKARKKQER